MNVRCMRTNIIVSTLNWNYVYKLIPVKSLVLCFKTTLPVSFLFQSRIWQGEALYIKLCGIINF